MRAHVLTEFDVPGVSTCVKPQGKDVCEHNQAGDGDRSEPAYGCEPGPPGLSWNSSSPKAQLEEGLRDAHSTNADLRERLVEMEKRANAANTRGLRGDEALAQVEGLYAKQKKAEDNAAAARRKQANTERELLRVRGELEELRERFDLVQEEAAALTELNARIETAKHAVDLLS